MGIRRAVAGRTHERVEAGGDVRVGVQVLPEAAPESLVIRRLAAADSG